MRRVCVSLPLHGPATSVLPKTCRLSLSLSRVTALSSRRLMYDYKCVRPCNMQTRGLTGNIMTRLVLTSSRTPAIGTNLLLERPRARRLTSARNCIPKGVAVIARSCRRCSRLSPADEEARLCRTVKVSLLDLTSLHSTGYSIDNRQLSYSATLLPPRSNGPPLAPVCVYVSGCTCRRAMVHLCARVAVGERRARKTADSTESGSVHYRPIKVQ